jgi:hypothetical protein
MAGAEKLPDGEGEDSNCSSPSFIQLSATQRGVSRLPGAYPILTGPPLRSCLVPLARCLSIFHSVEETSSRCPLTV